MYPLISYCLTLEFFIHARKGFCLTIWLKNHAPIQGLHVRDEQEHYSCGHILVANVADAVDTAAFNLQDCQMSTFKDKNS